MNLHHVAFWTNDIDRLEAFYIQYFGGRTISRFQDGLFSAIFLQLPFGLLLEIMNDGQVNQLPIGNGHVKGYSHLSIQVESQAKVDEMTTLFENEGLVFEKKREAYDDGFYESAIKDPDGNIIEIAYVDMEQFKKIMID